MADLATNASRLLQLFESMRHSRPGPALSRLQQMNLSYSHVRALHVLSCCEDLAMKDLAQHLFMTPPSVTALVRRLEQTGLVQRRSHTADSRVVLLSLTAEARELLTQLYQDQLQRMQQLLAGLSPEEQLLFLDLLERAVQATLQRPEPEPDRAAE